MFILIYIYNYMLLLLSLLLLLLIYYYYFCYFVLDMCVKIKGTTEKRNNRNKHIF